MTRERNAIALGLAGVATLAVMLAPISPPEPFPEADLVFHCCVFTVLGALTFASVKPRRRDWGLAALFAVALFMELAQAATPTRATELSDLIANWLGASLGFKGAEIAQTAMRAWRRRSEHAALFERSPLFDRQALRASLREDRKPSDVVS